MGKRIIQQRRGRGSRTYLVRDRAFLMHLGYPKDLDGEWRVIKLISSAGHSAPIAKFMNKEGKIFHNFAVELLYVGQNIKFGGIRPGDISRLGDLKNGVEIFNIESKPLDGGKFVRSGGNAAYIISKVGDIVKIMMPSKQEKKFSVNCRVTVGRVAGDGRLDKPILKAGKKYHIMKTKSKLWPRTSAVKMNAIDHPFGSGRGKRVKSKIAKRNAPPGKKVGLIRPRRTGRKKR
ncbi:MAG: 50S ribosomal protein L2 [archaeon]|nr:50S ribosomal protein L2 [archaeon]MCR4323812.1 50S ribosomal protein L2 [Nanoarchaeota archaeon]